MWRRTRSPLDRWRQAMVCPARYSQEMNWSASVFPAVQTVAFDADQLAQQRLQQYLLRHAERAALNNGQGVISFAKVSQLSAE